MGRRNMDNLLYFRDLLRVAGEVAHPWRTDARDQVLRSPSSSFPASRPEMNLRVVSPCFFA